MLKPSFFIAVGGGVKNCVLCGREKRLRWQTSWKGGLFNSTLWKIQCKKTGGSSPWLVMERRMWDNSAGDGSTSSMWRGPSGRWYGIHFQEGHGWEVNRDSFQLKCCQLSHATSRGWTFASFPWQAALKAEHPASQIVLGSCTSPPH